MNLMVLQLLLILFLVTCVFGDEGGIWPKPLKSIYGKQNVLLSKYFTIATASGSPRLKRAISRYHHSITTSRWESIVPLYSSSLKSLSAPQLNDLKVEVKSDNETLNLETDEWYLLKVEVQGSRSFASLKANNIYGAIRGLETFSQLIQYSDQYDINFVGKAPISIEDKPKFQHRGVLLDTSRNFFSVVSIKRLIDGMSYAKMNVFHWHIIDSHSFPFKSDKYPLLWQKGAYSAEMTYSKQDIRDLIQYGLDRGVRIIPEIEAPAHSYAIGLAYPDIAVCMDADSWDVMAAEPPSGQIDPTNPKSVKIVNGLIDEFSQLFVDEYLHLSGDEVNVACWNTSEKIREYANSNNIKVDKLLDTFAKGMHVRANKNGKSVMVWQEIILNHNLTLPENSLVQVWLGAGDTKKLIDLGYKVIASSYQYWYLDCGRGAWLGDSPSGSSWCDPFKAWQMVYSYDLLADLTPQQQPNVMGGEVTIWAEQVDDTNLDRFTWPRAAAAAEVLWSGNRGADDKIIGTKEVTSRLHNFRFRLVNKGIMAEPLQPLWCARNPNRCDSTENLKAWRIPYVPPKA